MKNLVIQFENIIMQNQNMGIQMQNKPSLIQNMGLQILNMGMQTINIGFQIPNFGFEIPNISQQIKYIGNEIQNIGIKMDMKNGIQMQMNNNIQMPIIGMNMNQMMMDNKEGWDLIFEERDTKKEIVINIEPCHKLEEAIDMYKQKSSKNIDKMVFSHNGDDITEMNDLPIACCGLIDNSRIIVFPKK